MDIRIVAYSEGRKEEIAALLNLCLGEKAVNRRDADYWEWKHERNPFGRSLMLLAENAGQLVGVRAFMRWKLQAGDRVIDAAKPVDSVTHPEFQRRGIFSKLTNAACEMATSQGVALLFNTPNKNSLPGYLKLGWLEIGHLPLRVKALRPFVSAARLVKSYLFGARTAAPQKLFRRNAVPADSILRRERLSEGLLDGPLAVGTWRTVRSFELLRWRYCEHPHIPYFAEWTERNGVIDGLLFYRMNYRGGLTEVMIDDVLMACEDWRKSATKLIEGLMQRVHADYLVAHAADDSPWAEFLDHRGFIRFEWKGPKLAVRMLRDDIHLDPCRIANWDLCLGDLEGL